MRIDNQTDTQFQAFTSPIWRFIRYQHHCTILMLNSSRRNLSFLYRNVRCYQYHVIQNQLLPFVQWFFQPETFPDGWTLAWCNAATSRFSKWYEFEKVETITYTISSKRTETQKSYLQLVPENSWFDLSLNSSILTLSTETGNVHAIVHHGRR